jgi:protocatechuate 3,4-dioxygenase beta subunit
MKEQKELMNRRDLLLKGLKAGAALGLGAIALNALGDYSPVVSKAMANIPAGALDFLATEPCVLACTTTLGPCYYDTGLIRRDITESSAGKVGLPTRLGFRIVNADTCEPIQGATVDIWHTDNVGVYSAPIGSFCNGTDTTAPTLRFGRGVQTTDANGWAYFDSFYPGWYSGRVTHIHGTISIGTTDIVTSQFFFADRVSEFIYRSHPNYSQRPNRDTTNATDNVIGGNLTRVMPYLFSTRMINDKYLQAVKTIGIRTTPTSCSA